MKSLKYIFSLTLCVALYACNMTEKPYTPREEDIFEKTNGAELITNSIYSVFWSSGLMTKAYYEVIDMDHDHLAAPSWVVGGAGEGNMTAHWSYNKDNDPFFAFYKIINRANYALDNLGKMKNPATPTNYGEAYFLRAFAYFHLVRMYGPVPLRLSSTDMSDRERSSVKQVYEQIVADLDRATDLLESWGTSSTQWGRANKTAAMLLKAKVLATMASGAIAGNVEIDVDIKGASQRIQTAPVDGHSTIDAVACYKRVKDICDSIIERRGIDYDLKGSFKEIWGSSNVRNNEFVWGVPGNSSENFLIEHLHYYYSAVCYNGRGWTGISTGAYGLYEDGDERGEHGVFHYIKPTFGDTQPWIRFPDNQTKYPTGPDGRATRFTANYYNTVYITKWYLGAGTVDAPLIDMTQPGYSRKAQDIPFVRFVDAYLLRAEAENELGNLAGALADLKIVRDRAKTSDLTGSVSSQDQMRGEILEERAREFMQEFNRKFDLLRYGLYLGVMNATGTVAIQGTAAFISKVREPKSVLYAVPFNEVLNNKLFGPNNKGW